MPERDLKADRAMCEAATPGPWFFVTRPTFREYFVRQSPEDWNGMGYQHICVIPAAKNTFHESNGHFIAEARTALPYYIDRTEAAEKRVERLEQECDHLRRMVGAAFRLWRSQSQSRQCGDGLCVHPIPNSDSAIRVSCGRPEMNCHDCYLDYLNEQAKGVEKDASG